jgi:diguanylate cyclase (GGDEF)-like protein
MALILTGWSLAMASALSWDRRYTWTLTGATLVLYLWTQGAAALAAWTGWVELITLGITPPLLAAQRARDLAGLKALHREEAVHMARLGDAARSLLDLQAQTQKLEAHVGRITDLYHVTKETSAALHVAELFAALLSEAPRFLSVQGLRLIDLTGQTPRVLRARRSGEGQLAPVPDGEGEPDAHEAKLIEQAKSAGRAAGAVAAAGPLPGGLARMCWAPMWQEQQLIGVLIADDLPAEQAATFGIVANQVALQGSRIGLYQQVESLAVTDALTGLSVRRHFLQRAEEELQRSKRHGLSCTLLMTDLDHFKSKNDEFGHLVGDVVLRDVARLLQRNLREVDMIARYGGEEFILLLIETDLERALPIAQRLKQLVEVHPIRAYDELLSQTISIGVATYPDHAQTVEQLIERADQALYAAKHAGRNQVVVWNDRIGAARGGQPPARA